MSCWLNGRLWRHEVDHVTVAYPGATWRERLIGGHSIKIWRVPVEPIPGQKQLPLVLADLSDARSVYFEPGGRIRHSPDCSLREDGHPRLLPRLRVVARRYTVEFEYPPARCGEAGPKHPRARVLQPEVSARTFPDHPHLNRTEDGSDSWACPIAPHTTDWKWREGATVEYLDQLAIWLLKTAVWLATGLGILGCATWIGPDAPHRPADVLASPSDAACRCGSGAGYGRCHMPRDMNALLSELSRG